MYGYVVPRGYGGYGVSEARMERIAARDEARGAAARASAESSILVTDPAGYTFRVDSNGYATIISGPSGVGKVYKPGDPGYDQVIANLAKINPAVAEIGGSGGGIGAALTSLASVFGAAQGGDTGAAASAGGQVASILSQFGPAIATGVGTLVQNRRSSLEGLYRRLGKAQAKYGRTRSASKRVRLRYEIQALQAQIRAQQAAGAAAIDAPAALPVSTGIPWVPIALGGGVLLVLAAVMLSRKPAGGAA